MLYKSINNEYIKSLKKLQIKKYRDQENIFLIEGEHLIKEAYQKGTLKLLILDVNSDYKLDVGTIFVTENVMKYLSELSTPPKMIGVSSKMSNKGIVGNRILILDDIQDPGNLGTIIRSAVAFNIDTIVLSENCVDVYNSKVIRGSQGLLFNMNIVIDNVLKTIEMLKNNDYQILGTKVNGGKSIKSIEKFKKFAIIMGNEGSGVSKHILNMCDAFIYIPMNENCESLNVGVATSIILYELSGK